MVASLKNIVRRSSRESSDKAIRNKKAKATNVTFADLSQNDRARQHKATATPRNKKTQDFERDAVYNRCESFSLYDSLQAGIYALENVIDNVCVGMTEQLEQPAYPMFMEDKRDVLAVVRKDNVEVRETERNTRSHARQGEERNTRSHARQEEKVVFERLTGEHDAPTVVMSNRRIDVELMLKEKKKHAKNQHAASKNLVVTKSKKEKANFSSKKLTKNASKNFVTKKHG